MTFYILDLYVFAALCLVFAVLCGGAGLVCWIGKAIDERHTRRICDCEEANGPDEWSDTEMHQPGDCDVCDTWRAEMEGE